MSRDDIMLIDTILDSIEEKTKEVEALSDKVKLIVKQITTQETLNDIMLELNKLNKVEETK